MSLASTAPVAPELEISDAREQAINAFKHGFPSSLVRWHYHDSFELHMIVASSGKVFVGDHVGAFSPGQVVLTGPRLPHNWISAIEPGENIPTRDLVIQFREDVVSSMVAIAPELASLMPMLARSVYGVEFSPAMSMHVETQMHAIIKADGPRRVTLLLELLDHLSHDSDARTLSTMPMSSQADEAALDKVEQVTQYVAENHAREIPLATVAGLVGMSESAFSRFFTKATGNGFTRFVNRVRIARACDLLSSSDLAITDICFEVGFNNVANFNRRFRELKDATPREYRRQSRLRHGVKL